MDKKQKIIRFILNKSSKLILSVVFQPLEINTPQLNDEVILYKLNAEVRQESRKNPNSNDVKEIIRKFKENHPNVIEIIRQRDRSNIRTDSSANYSDNLKKQNSLTENKIEHSFFEQKQRNNTFKTRPEKKPVVICNVSDFDNEHFNSDGCNTYSAQSPKEMRSHADKNKNLRPTVISSTTSENAENLDLNKRNYTSVKSSNELLTSVMNIDNDDTTNETQNEKEKPQSSSINDKTAVAAVLDIETRNMEAKTLTNEYNNNVFDINKHYPFHDNLQFENEVDMIDLVDPSSESDLNEALTQVIESIDELNADKSSDEMSIDEELVQESVNEINEDLAKEISILNIVLTPPMNFRD